MYLYTAVLNTCIGPHDMTLHQTAKAVTKTRNDGQKPRRQRWRHGEDEGVRGQKARVQHHTKEQESAAQAHLVPNTLVACITPLQHNVELGGILVGQGGPEVAADVGKRHRYAAVEERQGHHGGQQPAAAFVLLIMVVVIIVNGV